MVVKCIVHTAYKATRSTLERCFTQAAPSSCLSSLPPFFPPFSLPFLYLFFFSFFLFLSIFSLFLSFSFMRYNLHNINSRFTELCNQYHNSILKYFHHPQNSPSVYQQPLSIPSSRQPLVHFLSIWIYLYGTFHINRIIYIYICVCIYIVGVFVSDFFHSA